MEIKGVLEEFRKGIEGIYGKRLKSVILYGSWARGEATDSSDVDVVTVIEGKVVPGQEIDRMIDVITEIGLKHGVLLSVYPVSEQDFHQVNSPLLINVRREGVAA